MENIAHFWKPKRTPLIEIFLTILLMVLMSGISIAGLLLRDKFYPTRELLTGLLANDAVNLLVGLPVLVIGMRKAQRGSLSGWLCWPGALLYVFYNSLIYSLSMPFSWMYPVFPILTMLSLAGFILLVRAIPGVNVKERLEHKVAEKW